MNILLRSLLKLLYSSLMSGGKTRVIFLMSFSVRTNLCNHANEIQITNDLHMFSVFVISSIREGFQVWFLYWKCDIPWSAILIKIIFFSIIH